VGRLDNHLLLANSRRRSSAPGYAVPSETTPDPAFLLHTTEAGATLAGSGLSERRVLPDEVCLLSGDASATRLSKTKNNDSGDPCARNAHYHNSGTEGESIWVNLFLRGGST